MLHCAGGMACQSQAVRSSCTQQPAWPRPTNLHLLKTCGPQRVHSCASERPPDLPQSRAQAVPRPLIARRNTHLTAARHISTATPRTTLCDTATDFATGKHQEIRLRMLNSTRARDPSTRPGQGLTQQPTAPAPVLSTRLARCQRATSESLTMSPARSTNRMRPQHAPPPPGMAQAAAHLTPHIGPPHAVQRRQYPQTSLPSAQTSLAPAPCGRP